MGQDRTGSLGPFCLDFFALFVFTLLRTKAWCLYPCDSLVGKSASPKFFFSGEESENESESKERKKEIRGERFLSW